jgi:hypothetical protein
MDSHALSGGWLASAVEVLAANGGIVRIDKGLGYYPDDGRLHAILRYNSAGLAIRPDGIVITRPNPRKTVASSTTPLIGGRPKARSPSGWKNGPTSCSRRGGWREARLFCPGADHGQRARA